MDFIPTDIVSKAQAAKLRGWSVLPLNPDSKTPLNDVPWKNHLPFDKWPPETNGYGIDCGASGLLVIDIDGPEGAAAFDLLSDAHHIPELPDTYTVKTPHGLHLYFLAAGYRNSASKLADHVDIRSDGGYVVGAGSVVDGNEYTAISDVPVIPLPQWLARALVGLDSSWFHRNLEELAALMEKAPEGTRNDTLNQLAYVAYSNDKIPDDEATARLTEAARTTGLPKHEIQATLASAHEAAESKRTELDHQGDADASQARSDSSADTFTASSWERWNPDDWHEHGRTELETLCKVQGAGFGLFYAGKTNTVIAESEAGKSWLGLRACADEIKLGHSAAYIDFEDSGEEIYERLLLMVEWEQARELFHYFRPEEPIPSWFVSTHIAGKSLAVIDGYGEALALHGLKQDDEGVLKFNRLVSRPMSLSGAAVVHLDHFPKDTSNQKNAFGSVYKRNTVSGASYFLRNKEAFGKGQSGYSVLEVAKDRPGQIRQHCEKDGSDYYAAELKIDSSRESTLVKVVYPSLSHSASKVDYKLRVSEYMRVKLRSTKSGITRGVTGKNIEVWNAALELIKVGCLKEDGREIVFVRPYL